ncbi:hypothetical protein Sjap_001055 [Stephania japonica]|uniref:Pentatricopeptide repeat-containing protein n=1 Tax=Stephania japonica TaxID=461633 RepID=A0AAP0KK62_9MAGN
MDNQNDMSYYYSSLIKAAASEGELANAFKAFSLLQHKQRGSPHRFSILLQPICILLASCTSLKSASQGLQIHAHILISGLHQHPHLVPKLVTFYATVVAQLPNAHSIAKSSSALSHPVPWNILISAYVKAGRSGEALVAYDEMLESGAAPDRFTYPPVLKACGEVRDAGRGRAVHRRARESGVERSLFVSNALVAMYAKCGEIGVAREVFDGMPQRDVVSWNSIILGYASKGMWEEAFDLFQRMTVGGVEVNAVTLNTIAGGCLQVADHKRALQFISKMKRLGTTVDHVTLLIALGASSRTGLLKLGKEIHGSVVRSHYSGVETLTNALITMYSRCNQYRHSCLVFRLAESKSLITWNSVIAGCANSDQSEEAFSFFREMLASDVEPNYVTLASVLPLCARMADLQHGKELHCYITRRGGFEEYLLLWNSLIDMYAKSGRISLAQNMFDSMGKKDEVTYTSLIAGYGMRGDGRAALEIFDEMKSRSIKPDHITMVAVLFACSHSGMLAEGEMLFENMINVYKINPQVEHYACMVDLFGRAGLLRKAVDVIKRMPCRPNSALWVTLLGACRIHGNIDIGEWAAEKVLEMKPKNPGYYVLIANMYAAAGCWSKLAYVRRLMRDLGIRKTPGCAWVDVGEGFCEFSVEDSSNPHTQKIYLLLHKLTKLMKEAGYVASKDLDSADEEFE